MNPCQSLLKRPTAIVTAASSRIGAAVARSQWPAVPDVNLMETDINESVWSTPEGLKALRRTIPVGRIGQREDATNTALWLASDPANYAAGTALFVDDSMSRHPGFRDHG